jgi:hypothetical protein
LFQGWADLGFAYARNQVTLPLKPLLPYLEIDLDELVGMHARKGSKYN